MAKKKTKTKKKKMDTTKLPDWVMPGFTNVVPENAPNNFKDKYVLVLPPNPDDPDVMARPGTTIELPAASVGGYGADSARGHQHWQWMPSEEYWKLLRLKLAASTGSSVDTAELEATKAENTKLKQRLQFLEASEARKIQLLLQVSQSISKELET